jgi:hypothetical protein
MNRSTTLLLLAAIACAAAPAFAQVGVSVEVHQPGVYGRIDIGPQPPPVIYAQPIIIAPVHQRREPLYLYVPPGHQKKWDKHCAKYNACDRPVYFVREDWVQQRYDEAHGHKGKGKGHKHGKGHGNHDHDD